MLTLQRRINWGFTFPLTPYSDRNMRHTLSLLLSLMFFAVAGSALPGCAYDGVMPAVPGDTHDETTESGDGMTDIDTMTNLKITISVNGVPFSAQLDDSEAGRAFAALLPMTVTMTELNSNEKYYTLPRTIPVDAYRPGTIRAGDLMLWGGSTLVLFYETFSSSYSYTHLGRIENPDGLRDAAGAGDAVVTFMTVED